MSVEDEDAKWGVEDEDAKWVLKMKMQNGC
jgi:hypothetical protein